MQKKIKLLLAFVVMLVQSAGFVCDLHSDASHSEDSREIRLDSLAESHHAESHHNESQNDDCVSQPEMVALFSIESGMKAGLVNHADAFIASPTYLSIETAPTTPPSNWLSDPSISSPLRSMSPILRI